VRGTVGSISGGSKGRIAVGPAEFRTQSGNQLSKGIMKAIGHRRCFGVEVHAETGEGCLSLASQGWRECRDAVGNDSSRAGRPA